MVDLPLVAVLLGTDHHPFNRLLSWVADDGCRPARWFVQHGSTPLPPGLTGAPMLRVDELSDLLVRADAVVTHGGPGLIMEARAAGHRPVVVPRDPGLHEHVDWHQQRFTARLASAGTIRLALQREEFVDAVNLALSVPHGPAVAVTPTIVSQRLGSMIADLVQGA
jgi:UDP-N-acetylglucosamine transferase subunit ALG13